MSRRRAILSPHLDDAVLSCWHVLESPEDVVVVNVFTASPTPDGPVPWWDRETGATDSVARMAERRAEDLKALGLVSRQAIALDLLDDQYRSEAPPLGAVSRALERVLTPGSVIYAPAAIDLHPDHVLVRDAAIQLARAGWPLTIYARIPHAIVRGWPAWVTGEQTDAGNAISAHWTKVLAGAGLAVELLVPRVRPLNAGARQRKLRAIAAYETQRAALDRHSFLPLEDPRAIGWEVSWEVPPSALRSPSESRGEPVVSEPAGESLGDPG